jgi:hypothetical protein
MSKNLTRKGLAFGALVALTSSVFAGAPALAADSVTLEPAKGTSYNIILGEYFDLNSYFTAAAQQGAETQKFRIVDTEKKLTLGTGNTAVDTASATFASEANAANDDAGTNLVAADGIYVVEGGAVVGPTKDTLRLETAATATFSVTVQSWLDFDGDNLIDTGEAASTVRTIKFVKPSEVTATTTVTAPMVGDTTIEATLEFNDINNEQLTAANTGVKVTTGNGSEITGTASQTLVKNVAWSATDKFLYETSGTPTTAFAAGDLIKVQPLWKAGSAPAATDTIGSAVYATVAKRTIQTVTADIVRSVNAKTDATNVGTDSATQEVNRNKEFEFKITAKDDSVTPKGIAGLAVKISVYSSNFADISSAPAAANSVSLGSGSTDKKIIVNGTTYTDATKLPGYSTTVATIAATTDADGVAKVKIQTANFVVGDHVSAKFVVENFTKYVSAVSVDPSYSAHIANAETGVGTTDGVAAAVNVVVVDQFGGAPADGTWDARAVWSSNGQATTASTAASSTTKAVVGGKATLSILDNGTGVGTNVYAIKASKLADGGGYGTTVDIDDLEVNIKAAADLVAGKITSTGTYDSTTKIYANDGPTSLNLNDAKTYDSRLVLGDAPTVSNSIALSGVVSTANLTPIEGAALTISGAGIQFKKNNVTIYGKDSLTVYTNASGQWAIDVASNKAGKQTLTLTSGSVSQIVTVTFKVADADTGTALTLDAPAYVAPGRTLTLTAILTDKYGNGVDTDANSVSGSSVSRTVSVAWSGPGLVSGLLPTAFDADGKVTVKVLLGATETGSGVFTVKYDRNNDGDYTDVAATVASPDIVKTATVTVGTAPAAASTVAISASTGKFYTSVTNAAGKKVVVKVAGKFVKSFTGTAAKKTLVTKTTKGSKKVTVFVGGKLVATKTINVR